MAAWALAGPAPARANPIQALDNAWNLCARETARAERREGLPRDLLKAISLAESGRWAEIEAANVAWPWTVTAEGRGRFFDTKAEALAEVEFLMTQGVRNIDVGCMQVNLFYHGGAFETLDEAFDPRANTLYAASYLKNMYAATGDWAEAAGYYHSMTPERSGPYRDKVLAYWRQEQGEAAARPTPEAPPATPRHVTIDHARMAALNKRFKQRREARRAEAAGPNPVVGLEALRRRQLDEWRNATDRGLGTQHLVAMRRAELELKRKREADRLTKGDPETRFAESRRKQLRDWRLKMAGQAPAADPARVLRRDITATGMAAVAAGAVVR